MFYAFIVRAILLAAVLAGLPCCDRDPPAKPATTRATDDSRNKAARPGDPSAVRRPTTQGAASARNLAAAVPAPILEAVKHGTLFSLMTQVEQTLGDRQHAENICVVGIGAASGNGGTITACDQAVFYAGDVPDGDTLWPRLQKLGVLRVPQETSSAFRDAARTFCRFAGDIVDGRPDVDDNDGCQVIIFDGKGWKHVDLLGVLRSGRLANDVLEHPKDVARDVMSFFALMHYVSKALPRGGHSHEYLTSLGSWMGDSWEEATKY